MPRQTGKLYLHNNDTDIDALDVYQLKLSDVLYLAFLEIIVQGELQFAERLWLCPVDTFIVFHVHRQIFQVWLDLSEHMPTHL